MRPDSITDAADAARHFLADLPLDYALKEIARCSHDPHLRTGLKLHLGNSDVNLDDPEQVLKLQAVFRAADSHRMAIVVHLHANVDHHRPYGKNEAEIFLKELLPAAPHVTVQIAHLAGSGGFDDPAADSAIGVFLDAIAHRDPRMTKVYFDISGVAGLGDWMNKKQLIALRIRQAGVHRILLGSDGAWTEFTRLRAVTAFHELPLTREEFAVIERNRAPYLGGRCRWRNVNSMEKPTLAELGWRTRQSTWREARKAGVPWKKWNPRERQ